MLVLLSGLGWLGIATSSPTLAQDVAPLEEPPPELPSREEIESRLEERQPAEGETAGEGAQQEIEALNAALEALQRLEAVREELSRLETRVQEAPQELERLQRELREMERADQEETFDELEALSLEALEERRKEAEEALSGFRDRLAEVSTRLLSAQTLPDRAQQAIGEAMQQADESRRRLEELDDSQVAEDDPSRWQLRIQRELAEQTLQLHQRELATNTRLRELDQEHRDLLERQVASQEARLAMLQGIIDRRRREESEQAIAEAVSDDEGEGVIGHPVVRQAREINRTMSLELLRATDRANRLVREGLEVRRQFDRVRQLQRSLNEQIDAIRGSMLLSRILREQRQTLPRVEERRGLQDEIADLRLKQFELGRQREQLREGEKLARQRIEEGDAEASPALVDSLLELYQARRELVDQLEQAYGEMLSAAIDLQLNQQQLLATSQELRATINEQLFWIANSRPLGLAWLGNLPENLAMEWREGEWRAALPVNWRLPDAQALLGLPVLLAALGLVAGRRRIRARLTRLHQEVGHLKSDSQAHTPQAVALNALLALFGPLCVLAVGLALLVGTEGVAQGTGHALLHLALAWAVIAWARNLLFQGGVATRHFFWPPGYAAALRRWLRWLGVALVPVLLIGPLARDAGVDLNQRPLALGLLLSGLLAMSLVLTKLILAHVPFFGVKLFRLVLGLAIALVPLVLAGLIVYGFEYTALSLLGRFVITLYLLGLWILVEATVIRGLAVAARRLAYRRALARRRAQAQESAEGGLEVVEEPPLDMEQVNQQSLRLSKLILLIGFILVLYLVWSDLLSVFSYLEQVTLIEPGEGETVAGMVSVADIITALLVVVLTLMMARNLPGLLEVSVLSRLELKQGSAYAISSLLAYTIVGGGVVTALGTLGVSWSKLQWLVAALGVGLGFGLQEIFANFVSGLIILFERPVRIGDTITLGNLTGTVSKIRIRATTVTDFDRKEIIIPNKTFITDQLINWSLSDTVTRVVLSYGVAYGSDHRLVHRLLRQAADENPRVLIDPEPQVFFMSYGDSTLDFELRIFVNSLGDRLFATDEINCRVGELFAEHGLDIAFNQLDVWLHRAGGETNRVQSVSAGPVIPPEHPPPGAGGDPGNFDGGDGGGGDAGR
ncbi:mechanosensitive channel MscK [Halomonas rhizosphaerae]|uniref:Mechanosensitive channel MscK n=1 Tax=Halomonas rhizosphaerae TaxID=3043296 RepID=A0ABT6V4L3_9GAMM|nr:mechanosensitive channel MscK [Halomonas rhizosphaerae]MDI5893191.1 mechanosensitive channel MscK [Halomonas rhizosphaerae]